MAVHLDLGRKGESLAKTFLDYQPTKRFETGLIETIEYFKNLYSK